METKICFKCDTEKPLSEFYKHPKMIDGHVNKCKVCNKKDVQENYKIKSIDDDWMEKERARGREKHKRLNYALQDRERVKQLFWCNNYYKRFRILVSKKMPLTQNEEIHHWNYNLLDNFFILDIRQHRKIHKKMTVNKETGIFTSCYGDVLDTAEKHSSFIASELAKIGEVVDLKYYSLESL